jgi:predicted transposase/invertase (TIGR01784 family)
MFWQKPDSARWHHSFRLRCDQNVELILTNDLEFHIIELPKYEPSSDNIEELPPDEKWVYLFKYAAEVEPERLAELLRDPPYREAIGVLQMISQSPEDLQYYEDRLKFLRDEQGKLLAAKQEGEQLGLARGREEGREEGREQGKLAGKIQMIQELLGDAVDSDEALLSHDRDTLTALLSDLQTRLRRREA